MKIILCILIIEHIIGLVVTFFMLTRDSDDDVKTWQRIAHLALSILWPVTWLFAIASEISDYVKSKSIK